MQFGSFLLFLVATLIVSCQITSGTINTLSRPVPLDNIARSSPEATRFLRSNTAKDAKQAKALDEAEPWNTIFEENSPKLTGEQPKKTLPPPKADTSIRSKWYPSDRTTVMAQQMILSKFLPNTKAFIIQDVLRMGRKSLRYNFKKMDMMKKTPDDIVGCFSLDTKLLMRLNKNQLRKAAKGDKDALGENELWYKYTEYYKKEHPGWYSKLVKEKLD